MMLPLTSLPQSWRGGSWTIAVFVLFIKLGAQFARWLCNKRLFLLGASMARWTYFSSRSHFWVNFGNLSLLMFFLLLPYELQVYSSKVLMFHHQVWLDFPILIVWQEILASHRLSSKKYFSFAEKWGCTITSSEWVETYHFWTLLIISSLITHNHSSRFTVVIVIYHTFGWIMNNCHHNYVGIARRRQYNNKLIISRNI